MASNILTIVTCFLGSHSIGDCEMWRENGRRYQRIKCGNPGCDYVKEFDYPEDDVMGEQDDVEESE